MSGSDPLFKLRLPEPLREKLQAEAKANLRSLTAEILGRLEMSFSELTERVDSLKKQVFDGKRGNEAIINHIINLHEEVKSIWRDIAGIANM